jgi:hypothetical protein
MCWHMRVALGARAASGMLRLEEGSLLYGLGMRLRR